MARSESFLLSVVLVACGGSGDDPSIAEAQRAQDMWEIDQIEKDFHEATSVKDIDLMMSLYAPNATFTVGGGATAVGVDEIRDSGWTSRRRSTPRTTGSPITRPTSSRSR